MSTHRYHELKVVHRATTSLTPYPGNARQHPRKQIAKLAEQILAVGWINPIIADEDNMILAGHGRLEAAKKAGLITVPVNNVHGLTKGEKISYVLSDNRMGDESTFSKQQLRVELEGLIELGANLDLTGFTTLEIETTLSIGDDDAATNDDNVELPDDGTKPVSRRGDLWHIGVHKALCEDSRDPKNYARLLGDERAELVFSDPPYNTKSQITSRASVASNTRTSSWAPGSSPWTTSPRRCCARCSNAWPPIAPQARSPSSARTGVLTRTCSPPRGCVRRAAQSDLLGEDERGARRLLSQRP